MKAVINGKETELKFDFGTVRLFNKESGKKFLSLKEKEYGDEDVIAYLLLAVAKRGNPEITIDDIDSLMFAEINELSQKMRVLIKEFFPVLEAKGKGPLAQKKAKPQS